MSDTDRKVMEDEVRQWVDRLLSGPQRGEAAAELSRLGVWTRGSVRTRGSLAAAAVNRLPELDRLGEVIRCLEDTDRGVRRQVAAVLGEWGGEEAALALREMLGAETDEEVQLSCITALKTIGGPTAAEGLRGAAARGSDAVRHAAVSGIEELATGGRVEDTELPAAPSSRGAERERGTVEPGPGDKVREALAETLRRVSTEETASPSLRQRAARVQRFL